MDLRALAALLLPLAGLLVGLGLSGGRRLADELRSERPAREGQRRRVTVLRQGNEAGLLGALRQGLERDLLRAGIYVSPGRALAAALGLGALLAVAGLAAGLSWWLVPLLLLAPLIGGRWWLRQRAQRRTRRLEEALVEALPLLSAALRAGRAVGAALEGVAMRAPSPLREELETVLWEVRLGRELGEAMGEMATRTGSAVVALLAAAIGAQRESGGSLGPVLRAAQEALEDRIKLEGEIRALTAQQRLSAYLLAGLPAGVLAILSLIAPSYVSALWGTGMGRMLLLLGLALEAMGVWAVRRLVRLEV